MVVHPGGAEAARRDSRMEELVREGRTVLLIDAFQTGAAVAERDLKGGFFLTFNRSDDANRVQDILTALAFLDEQRAGEPTLLGIGKAGAWARFAKAMSPRGVKLSGDSAGFGCSDAEFQKDLFVPGIQRVAEPCSK